MRTIIKAMSTWNPGMWVGLTGMTAILCNSQVPLWISIPSGAAFYFLLFSAVVVTIAGGK